MMPNQVTNVRDLQLIRRIVARALQINQQVPLSRLDLRRDIGMVHTNGCPLHLWALLHANEMDFIREVLGIHRHLNRETGQLDPIFAPRFVRHTRAVTRRRAA